VFGKKNEAKTGEKKERRTRAVNIIAKERNTRGSGGRGRDGRRGEERERFVAGFSREKRSLKRSLRISPAWTRKGRIMGKQLSGAQKRKKKKEREEAIKEAAADMERLKLGPSEIWTGLVLHHKDIFVS
jgi:hypothetical protein|tara:strand:+ start:209 stop:595 length:387 start_codon:yes stop_codon:yes gene_type:complete